MRLPREGRAEALDRSARPAGSRRRRFRLRVLPLLVVGLVGGWCVWAATTDGGISGRVDDVLGRARGAVESATEGNVDAAARYLDQRYAEAGTYPVLDEEAMRAAEQLGWGVGVEYFRCSAHHAVVQALTARGTVSRLLVDGESWGDVPGNPGCPAGLVDPTPWTAPPGG